MKTKSVSKQGTKMKGCVEFLITKPDGWDKSFTSISQLVNWIKKQSYYPFPYLNVKVQHCTKSGIWDVGTLSFHTNKLGFDK